jgi:hypothetical protein
VLVTAVHFNRLFVIAELREIKTKNKNKTMKNYFFFHCKNVLALVSRIIEENYTMKKKLCIASGWLRWV